MAGGATSRFPSDTQWMRLLEIAEGDTEIRTGQFLGPHGKQRVVRKWEKIAEELNSMNGAVKTGPQWKDAFKNLKARAFLAHQEKVRYMKGTGGGESPEDAELGLSDVYSKVLTICGTVKAVGNEAVGNPLEIQKQKMKYRYAPGGISPGYNSGRSSGYNSGRSSGYNSGRSSGYNSGRSYNSSGGRSSSNNTSGSRSPGYDAAGRVSSNYNSAGWDSQANNSAGRSSQAYNSAGRGSQGYKPRNECLKNPSRGDFEMSPRSVIMLSPRSLDGLSPLKFENELPPFSVEGLRSCSPLAPNRNKGNFSERLKHTPPKSTKSPSRKRLFTSTLTLDKIGSATGGESLADDIEVDAKGSLESEVIFDSPSLGKRFDMAGLVKALEALTAATDMNTIALNKNRRAVEIATQL